MDLCSTLLAFSVFFVDIENLDLFLGCSMLNPKIESKEQRKSAKQPINYNIEL